MRRTLAAAALSAATLVLAETPRTFDFGKESLVAIQDAPATMPRRLFPALSETDFAALAGGAEAPASVNVFLLRREGHLILVDAGNGGRRGRMLATLKAAGIQPDAIGDILLTHMHGDHIGGLIDATGAAVFPKATLHVAAPERDHWQTQAGHTPGHTVYETESFLIVGDLLHAAAVQFPRPEIGSTYDVDPTQAAATRRRFYARAAASGKTIAGMHLPYPGLGTVAKDGEGFRYVPAP